MKRCKGRGIALMLVLMFGLGMTAPMTAGAGDQDDYFSVLLLGTDEGAHESIVESETEYGRSDAMMLLSLHKQSGALRMLSLERDYRTDILNDGPTKLCIVCLKAGPEKSLEAVNQLLGLNIRHYALIDPPGMEAVANALGGIDLEIREDELWITRDSGGKAFKRAGMQHLDGRQVRAYVRRRDTAIEDSDLIRNEQQVAALTALIKKALDAGQLGLLEFAQVAMKHVKTNIGLTEILTLAEPLLGGGHFDVEFAKSPLTEAKLQTVNLHRMQVLIDPATEVERVGAFLYSGK